MIGAILLLLGGALALGGSSETPGPLPSSTPRPSTGGGGSTPTPSSTGGIVWHDARGTTLTNAQRRENYDAAYLMGKSLEDAGLFGPDFATWLRVVARTEARGNPAAGSDAFSNAARGLLGLRPTTAWNESACIGGTGANCEGGIKRQWSDDDPELAFRNGAVSSGEVEALKDMPWTIALAAHLVSRLRKYTKGGAYTLLGARRGWAFPSLVSDHDNSERPELLDRWNDALGYFQLPSNFGERAMPVLVSRSDFPSVEELHAIIMAAVAGGGSSSTDETQEGFVAGSVEDGGYQGTEGYVYSWALGQRDDLTWTWGADRYPPDSDTPDAHGEGDTETRSQAVAGLTAAIETWEDQHS